MKSAAQDRAEGAQDLAEGEQAARGAAEPTRENLARSTVGSSPDAGTAAQGRELEGPEGIYNPATQRDPNCRLCQEDKFHTVHTSSAASSHASDCQVHNANPPWACTCGHDLLVARQESQRLREALTEIVDWFHTGIAAPPENSIHGIVGRARRALDG